jgi:glycosyltransferase involved in cell wall biosynthesis
VVEDLAQAMLTLANDRDIAARMSQNALDYARTQDWSAAVTRIYARIQRLSTISHRAATGVLPSQSAVNVEFE